MVEGNVKRDTNTLISARKVCTSNTKKLQEGVPHRMTHYHMILKMSKDHTVVSLTNKSHRVPLCVKYRDIYQALIDITPRGLWRFEQRSKKILRTVFLCDRDAPRVHSTFSEWRYVWPYTAFIIWLQFSSAPYCVRVILPKNIHMQKGFVSLAYSRVDLWTFLVLKYRFKHRKMPLR